MADQALHLRPDADLEAALRAFGEDVAWPEAAVRPRGDRPRTDRVVATDRRAGTARAGPGGRPGGPSVAAVLILLVLAALAGAAGLGLPGLRLILGPAPVSPPPSLAPSASPAAGLPGSTLASGEQVPLEDLDARAGFDGRAGRPIPPSDRPTPPTSIRRWVARSRSSGGRATGSPTRSSRESASSSPPSGARPIAGSSRRRSAAGRPSSRCPSMAARGSG